MKTLVGIWHTDQIAQHLVDSNASEQNSNDFISSAFGNSLIKLES